MSFRLPEGGFRTDRNVDFNAFSYKNVWQNLQKYMLNHNRYSSAVKNVDICLFKQVNFVGQACFLIW